jgi:hypothetical protein
VKDWAYAEIGRPNVRRLFAGGLLRVKGGLAFVLLRFLLQVLAHIFLVVVVEQVLRFAV